MEEALVTHVYFGCYTNSKSDAGVHLFDFDEGSGRLHRIQSFPVGTNPSYLAINLAADRVYAVNEVDEGRVVALERDPDSGELSIINSQSSEGASPCHVAFDPSGRFLLV